MEIGRSDWETEHDIMLLETVSGERKEAESSNWVDAIRHHLLNSN